ncbi:unnamed protein product [Pleuronectes platessa]|uniref:Uncharacterized protein n=1 Tax=Pleuronectes platessa TaxID=8262 RepID=A0A9N7UY82_PLEPL|nr:unnamed protein product [Pleuronectes platessa]
MERRKGGEDDAGVKREGGSEVEIGRGPSRRDESSASGDHGQRRRTREKAKGREEKKGDVSQSAAGRSRGDEGKRGEMNPKVPTPLRTHSHDPSSSPSIHQRLKSSRHSHHTTAPQVI